MKVNVSSPHGKIIILQSVLEVLGTRNLDLVGKKQGTGGRILQKEVI